MPPNEQRTPAREPSPTPTEACPAAHAARDMAATPPCSRSRRSDLHAWQADTSCQPATVREMLEPSPRPPEAALPCRHPQLQLTATTMASTIHAARQAVDEASPCMPGAAAPTSSSPAALDHAGTGETCRPPLPAVRSWEHHPTAPNAAMTSQRRHPGFLEQGRPARPRSGAIWTPPTRPPRTAPAEDDRRPRSRPPQSQQAAATAAPTGARRVGLLWPDRQRSHSCSRRASHKPDRHRQPATTAQPRQWQTAHATLGPRRPPWPTPARPGTDLRHAADRSASKHEGSPPRRCDPRHASPQIDNAGPRHPRPLEGVLDSRCCQRLGFARCALWRQRGRRRRWKGVWSGRRLGFLRVARGSDEGGKKTRLHPHAHPPRASTLDGTLATELFPTVLWMSTSWKNIVPTSW
jgi:hypothetical protein